MEKDLEDLKDDLPTVHDAEYANHQINATKAMPDLTTKQLLEAERSHIFEVRIRQSEIIRQAGNIRYKQSTSSSSSSSSSSLSTPSSFVAIAEAIELYQRALYHVDFEKSTYEFQLTPAHKAQIRATQIPIYLNLPRCAMRQERYRDSINHCKSAVEASSGYEDGENSDPVEMDLIIKANWIAGKAYMELSELDTAMLVFQSILADNNDNEEAKAMIANIKKEKQRSSAVARERWGGKLGGAAPVPSLASSTQAHSSSLLARTMSDFRVTLKGVSWTKIQTYVSDNIEYIVGAFFAMVGVVVFYHICDRILYKMPSR